MQARIACGEDAAALARIAAIPGRDHAARALNDRDQRDDVEILKSSFDHEVDLTEREQTIVVAVAAEAPEAHLPGDAREARLLLAGLEQIWARRGEQRIAKAAASAAATALRSDNRVMRSGGNARQ